MELRLLVVDADDAHRCGLSAQLRNDGFTVSGASSASEALELANRSWPHLVLADLSFPDGSAERLAIALNRTGDLPIVVLTACDNPATRIWALTRFAEDYVTRPYSYEELLARVRRVLRRSLIGIRVGDERINLGDGRWVDLSRREIGDGKRTQRLTPTESRLLALFLLNVGQVLPIDLILQRVWCDAPAGANTLWEYVRRLRIKLADDARNPYYIVSSRGIGYQFRLPREESAIRREDVPGNERRRI